MAPVTVNASDNVAAPLTANVLESVVAPVTPRVLAKVDAPETSRPDVILPIKFTSPLTVKSLRAVTVPEV